MNRRAFVFAFLFSALLALAACTTTDDDATDDVPDEEPTPTEAVSDDTAAADDDVATDDEATDAADDAEPAADDVARDDDADLEEFDDEEELQEALEEGEVSLEPPVGFLHADDEEYESVWGAWFWVHDPTGLAAEVTPPYFEFDEVDQAVVEDGEEIEFSFDFDDYDPEQMTVKVYELEDEYEDNRTLIDWEPMEEHELDEGEFSWTVDLDAGEYIIVVNTIWPTDMDAWHREQEVDYRWWVEVE